MSGEIFSTRPIASTLGAEVHDFGTKQPFEPRAQAFLSSFVSDENIEEITVSPLETEKIIQGIIVLLGARTARTDPRAVITELFIDTPFDPQENSIQTQKTLKAYINNCLKNANGPVSIQELVYLAETMKITTVERRFETRRRLLGELSTRALGQTIVPPGLEPIAPVRLIETPEPAVKTPVVEYIEPLKPTVQINSENWRQFSACDTTTARLFDGDEDEKAKAICNSCQVQEYCLKSALDNNERFSIWGGLTTKERDTLKQRQSRSTKS